MSKVLVIGGGGREQALAWKLAQSEGVEKVFIAPGNGGSDGLIENVALEPTDVDGLLKFAEDQTIDLTVVGQEAASEAGVVDAFRAKNLLIFGPTKAAVQLEASKVFSKDLMAAENIPTAEYRAFDDPTAAAKYAKTRPLPVVIKADGLAAGKGVIIIEATDEIDAAIHKIMVDKEFGAAGNKIVVEDFLRGQEVSTHALCDGKSFVLFPSSQDHKQAFDGDKGPNTGGMGVIAPVSWVTDEHMRTVADKVVTPALKGMEKQNATFAGCMYPGLMIDGQTLKVLEFNARFGDPEAEVYMRLFDGDLYRVLRDCALGRLNPGQVKWQPGFAVSVVMASGGYPGEYEKGLPIAGLDEAAKMPDVVIFHAGTKRDGDQILTAGGRVLNVTTTGTTLDEALEKAYAAVDKIHFKGAHFRRDIGRRVK
ncbi:phosphoribosylamine--glycine ligase [Candidatus Saccharibacteria bacterium]|nr:phosphoribosylamine--glycine ligase [Candidatus Saccharibacteria bacterium]